MFEIVCHEGDFNVLNLSSSLWGSWGGQPSLSTPNRHIDVCRHGFHPLF